MSLSSQSFALLMTIEPEQPSDGRRKTILSISEPTWDPGLGPLTGPSSMVII